MPARSVSAATHAADAAAAAATPQRPQRTGKRKQLCEARLVASFGAKQRRLGRRAATPRQRVVRPQRERAVAGLAFAECDEQESQVQRKHAQPGVLRFLLRAEEHAAGRAAMLAARG